MKFTLKFTMKFEFKHPNSNDLKKVNSWIFYIIKI